MKKSTNMTFFLAMLVLLMPVGAYAASGTVHDLITMLQTLNTNVPAVRQGVVAFCYVFGLATVARSVFMLKKFGEQRSMMSTGAHIGKPLIVLAVGVGLMGMPTIIDSAMDTLYAYGSSSVMEYPAPSNWSSVTNPLIQVVKLLGFVVFVKGWIMLARFGGEGGNQPGTGGKAAMHMIGGILAMNIVGTINIINGTFGL